MNYLTRDRLVAVLPHISWTVALIGTLVSLYFSEVLGWVPCILCWYQRILLYPLVVILAVGILRRDRNVIFYTLPLSVLGMGIALYHQLLQVGIIPEAVAPCTLGVSCAEKQLAWLGFVTIPFLSLVGFTVITCSMLAYYRWSTSHE
jgi:disulfide bond formation protein DsbB